MRHATAADLHRAFERAATASGPDDPGLSDATVAQAWAVLQARRGLRSAETCPTPVLRRVQGFFASRPRGGLRLILDRVFDSRATATPALRGVATAPRTMRFSGGGMTVDLQVRAGGEGSRALFVAATPTRPGLEVRVHALPGGTARRAVLDAAGTARIELPLRASQVQVAFHVEGGETFRIERIALD